MYSSVRERLIHLHHCRGVGWKTIDRLLRIDPSLSSIFSLPSSTIASMMSIFHERNSLFFQDLHSLDIKSMIKTYKDKNIDVITVLDDDYPEWLKHSFEPPWVLYAKGKIEWLSHLKMLSIVGTRQPTTEGIRALQVLIPPLVQAGWTIVSGLALGIDAAAHEITIEQHGKTIAVIAGGVEHIYPKQNRGLAERLMRDHLIISEYPPHTKPQKWQFPLRNRIISGLSLGTVVVQAKEKSGSLITASLALEQGREVFAVPGSIFLEQASGTNKLIQQGAKLVCTAQDIIDEFAYIFPSG
ncbi:DNA-processing protein DprA [Anoxybacillus sp. J5B_2022]|uniref:DNA-processing protein DprA n=1 Tax=Anoxybacillus sp. J5B_2022 TaxID=3003246 RepID=UPI002285C01A|nr:DNA-processing protein DprA [Anoxybacillus sp. J5B_2022]MCZ0755323.1 DNA-processing protein DprA [Anoxybacillus sp. J5B_2022]